MKQILFLLLITLGLQAEVKIGDKAKDFNLATLNTEKKYTMNDFKGKVTLLNIWASWCKGCKEEMPAFFDLQNQYKNDFQIVTVSVDDKVQKSISFMEKLEKKKGFKTPFVSLYDSKKTIAKSYNCVAMPSSYLIDKNGIIQDIIIGSLDNDDILALKKKIDSLR